MDGERERGRELTVMSALTDHSFFSGLAVAAPVTVPLFIMPAPPPPPPVAPAAVPVPENQRPSASVPYMSACQLWHVFHVG
eukprot:1120115-Rhodomonas_salina.1